jgi:condensin-2 complex subunit D3
LNLLLLRCEEERFNFKKSAILAIQALVLAIPTPDAVNAAIEKLSKKCRDLALAIRKLAAQSLTRLLHSLPQQEKLQNAWLHSVMHQIIDREPSVQQGSSVISCFMHLLIIFQFCRLRQAVLGNIIKS